jgi:uncharacterized SAM-binding protein YcdF (DUF218 family)
VSRRRLLVGGLLGLAILGSALALLHRPILRAVGAWLQVEDRLERADAIVVLAGGTPWREAAAAELWQAGWAPRVIISRPAPRPDLEELVRLGIRAADQQGEARLALEKFGVPGTRITAIPEPAGTTEPELHLVHLAARAAGYHRLIFVTSPEHSRRVKLIWSRESRDVQGLVTVVREGFPFDDWWRRRRAAEAVLHEYLGLLAITLGISPLMR